MVLTGSTDEVRTGSAAADPHPRGGGVRAARQLRTAVALGLPHDVHGVPAARQPDRRLAARGAARAGHRRGRASATPSASRRVAAQTAQPRGDGGARPAGRRVVATLVAALFYGLATLVLLGLTAGLAQSLAKLSLDSTIQRDIPSRIQASAFARSDTTLQLAWVIGGFVGIAMPLMPQLGLGIAAGGAGPVGGVRAASAAGPGVAAGGPARPSRGSERRARRRGRAAPSPCPARPRARGAGRGGRSPRRPRAS